MNGKLVTDRKDVLQIWEEYFKELLNQRRATKKIMADRVGVRWTRRLLDICTGEVKISEDLRTGLTLPMWKRKGDVHDPVTFQGITLLSHFQKVLERILGGRIRRIVESEMGEEQQGFRRGRGAADGMFTLRQLEERRLEG